MAVHRKVREAIYFGLHSLAGIQIGKEYARMLEQDRSVDTREAVKNQLIRLLDHCKQSVPYYTELMKGRSDAYREDPEGYLADFPILTKDLIRENFDRLKSADIHRRKWRYNTSGGSTGEPVRLVQDNAFIARAGALQWLSHDWAGRKFGERGVRVWGSVDDVVKNSMGLKMNLINYLTNDTWFNAFRMTPERMRTYLEELNYNPPKLIIAYAQAIYELARFAEKEGVEIKPQSAVLTSAGTLYPFMREKIETVFHCQVFNRYGSREVGDIACECHAHSGMHIFPWGSYVEIVDEDNRRVPYRTEGSILVTPLANYVMPLIRYSIGDRGILSPDEACACGRRGIKLDYISGRDVDAFRKKDGTLIDGEYFTHLLYFRDWVGKFQIIQNSYSSIIYKIVKTNSMEVPPDELENITEQTQAIMGEDCEVKFEFVEEIPALGSGKYRYTMSEINTLTMSQ